MVIVPPVPTGADVSIILMFSPEIFPAESMIVGFQFVVSVFGVVSKFVPVRFLYKTPSWLIISLIL